MESRLYNGMDEDYMPLWGYGFIVVCILIPVLSIEGLIPWIIGITGAVKCKDQAKNGRMSFKSKFIRCLIITVIAVATGVLNYVLVKYATGYLSQKLL